MSLKHAILGFLSFAPLSGYDLKKSFDRSVQHFWPADQSQIYRTLNQLEKEGLVVKEVVPRQERLDIKRYHITPAGVEELHGWLTTPLPEEANREPFLLQLFFGGRLEDAQIAALLENELRRVAERLEVYRQMYHDWLAKYPALENQRAVFYTLLTLEYGLRSNQTFYDWLQATLARVLAGDYHPQEM